jgi:hypothetical protein
VSIPPTPLPKYDASPGFFTDNSLSASIQFNIVSKHLGAERMSFYLSEAASDIRDMLMPCLEPPKAKL